MPSGGTLGPPHRDREEGPGGCPPASRCPRAAPASGPLANHDPPLPRLHARPAWTFTRLATLSENPASALGTTRHPLHKPEKVAALTPARPEPPTTPAPSWGLCPGHGAPCPAHSPASRLPVPQQAQTPHGQGAPSTNAPRREHRPHGRGVRDLGTGRGPCHLAARPRPLPSVEPVAAGQPGVAAGLGHAPPLWSADSTVPTPGHTCPSPVPSKLLRAPTQGPHAPNTPARGRAAGPRGQRAPLRDRPRVGAPTLWGPR